MKRFDNKHRDEGKKRPPFSGRDRSFGERREGGFDSRPSSGGRHTYESRGGFDNRRSGGFESRGRPRQDDRSAGFAGRERRFDGDDRRRNTFRREDGPGGGYGRPAFGQQGGNRYEQPRSAPPAPRAEAAAPSRGPVPLARLKNGVREANRALAEVVEQFGHTLEGGYDISELEVTVSFGEDGRFLGFGRGGAAAMTLSITPVDSEALLGTDEDEETDIDESIPQGAMAHGDFDDDDDDDSTLMRSTNTDLDVTDENEAEAHRPDAEPGERAAVQAAAQQPTFDA